MKTSTESNGLDHLVASVVGAAQGSPEEAIETWRAACNLYARYFEALAETKDPQTLMSANADFVTGMLALTGVSAKPKR